VEGWKAPSFNLTNASYGFCIPNTSHAYLASCLVQIIKSFNSYSLLNYLFVKFVCILQNILLFYPWQFGKIACCFVMYLVKLQKENSIAIIVATLHNLQQQNLIFCEMKIKTSSTLTSSFNFSSKCMPTQNAPTLTHAFNTPIKVATF
jgi:hypothetical protein